MSNKKINIILDNDGSSDDAIAFALASNSSKINLIAVVSSYGSNTIEINTNNNAEYISATKTDTKLYIGAGASLDGKTPAINLFYGEDNKCLAQLEKHKSADTKAKNIYKKLWKKIKDHEKVTYVVTGPCTNLANLIYYAGAKLWKHIDEVVIVGGNPAKSASNFHADVRALKTVLDNCTPTIVTQDATELLVLQKSEIDNLQGDKKVQKFFKEICNSYFTFKPETTLAINDGLTILYIIYKYTTETLTNIGVDNTTGKLVKEKGQYSYNNISFPSKEDIAEQIKSILEF